jgi:hypothetical protein
VAQFLSWPKENRGKIIRRARSPVKVRFLMIRFAFG